MVSHAPALVAALETGGAHRIVLEKQLGEASDGGASTHLSYHRTLAAAAFLAGVRRLCDAHGVLMIADEVLTGFGRLGEWFAWQTVEGMPAPDLMVEIRQRSPNPRISPARSGLPTALCSRDRPAAPRSPGGWAGR